MSRKIKFSIPDRQPDLPDQLNHPDGSSDSADIIPLHRPETEPVDKAGLFSGTRERPKSKSMFGGANGMRLGMLCLMLVMVIYAMIHASRPESWNWLFKFDKVRLEQTGQSDQGATAGTPGLAGQGDGAETNSFVNSNRSADGKQAVTDSTADSTMIATTDRSGLSLQFWRQVLRSFDGQQQLRLFNLVQAVSRQTALKSGQTNSLRPVVARLDSLKTDFVKRLESKIDDDSNDNDNSAAVTEFTQAWDQSIRPAMDAVLKDHPDQALINVDVTSMADLLQIVSAEQIRDKTPIQRVQEAYAWFAAWSEVYDQPIDQQVQETATVTQLIAQPEAWRGQTIHVTGTALRVERVDASHNALGIERYYVIWIKPDHPSSFPYCVYSLMAPESLMGEPDQKMREVEQRVEADARFFKNRLFDAGESGGAGEAAVAPVLLSTSVRIPRRPAKVAKEKFQVPGTNVVLLTLAIIVGMSSLIALTVYRTTLSGRVRALPKKERLANQFSLLKEDRRVETTLEKLQRLSNPPAIESSPSDSSPDESLGKSGEVAPGDSDVSTNED